MADSESLTTRFTVSELTKAYEEATADIREAFAKIAAAEDKLNSAFTLDHWSGLDVCAEGNRNIKFKEPEDTLNYLERRAWQALVERLDIRRMMSIRAWTKLQKQLDEDDMPPLTTESVSVMVQGFQNQLPSMLEGAIEEVFDFLRPRRSKHKTNSEEEIGSKVILTHVVHSKWVGKGFEPNYSYEPQFTALENVFSALDGRGQITKTYFSELSNAIKACEDGKGDTRYFRFKCYKNSNLHLEFLRPDLLKRFNQVAGGMRLKKGT